MPNTLDTLIDPTKKDNKGNIDTSESNVKKWYEPSNGYIISIRELENITKYNFFSNLSREIQDAIENKTDASSVVSSASLLADFEGLQESSIVKTSVVRLTDNSSIWENRLPEKSLVEMNTTKIFGATKVGFDQNSTTESGACQIGCSQTGSCKIGSFQKGSTEIGSTQQSPSQIGVNQISLRQVSPTQTSSNQLSSLQIGSQQIGFGHFDMGMEKSPSETGIDQNSLGQIGTNPSQVQFGISQIGSSQINVSQSSTSQVSTSQIGSGQIEGFIQNYSTNPTQVDPTQVNLGKVLFSSTTSFEKFFPIHDSSPNVITNIYNTAQTLWQANTDLNLTFNITNLPTGQLAEATITSYNNNGTPNAATISIDDDANGIGWFIDTTPQDNSEFTGTDTYFQATPNSPASGKYDLLTAILHEMGHTLGFINGYSQFNQNIKGRQFYTDSTHSYTLSADLSHLDNTLYPNDLLNTNLKPGIRKLPSTMDWAIINAINSGVANGVSSVGTVNPANLTAGALIGITNGDFTTPTTWNTEGATNIINGTATLTEQSQKLSELTQAFIIPTGAKTLQFTIKDNHLVTGDTTKTANDAFEVALLDSNTFTPLAGTSIGLNHTDSLLNIQANGTIHKSDKVTITALTNNSSIVTIDLTAVTPSTQATLYFNLLGFGARTSTVTIDDVKLFTDTQPIPVTKNDTLVTNQNTPLTLDPTQLTTNDTNVTQIQIINQPTHGTLTQTPDGKFTYQPVSTYVGNDSFTYLGFGSDGQISNLGVTYSDPGIKDTHTITWNFDDGSDLVTRVRSLGFILQPNLQIYFKPSTTPH
jgi:Bacterial Ig domain